MEVLFLEGKSDLVLDEGFLKEILEKTKGKSVGLATTVQYLQQIEELDRFLQEKGVKTHKGNSPLCENSCQILGCSVIEYKTDMILYLGTGKFHPIGLAVWNNCPVLIANPQTNELRVLDESEVRKYKMKIEVNKKLVKDARVIGILVSSKKGQSKREIAQELKRRLENDGKEIYLFLFDTLDFDSFLNYTKVEAYINTACPRIFDDIEKFNKPLINIYDYER